METSWSSEHGMTVRRFGAGPELVWIHGLGESSVSFDAIARHPALAGYAHTLPDLPGYGRSPWPHAPVRLGALSTRLAVWLAERPRALVIASDVGAVTEGIVSGAIDVLATDHAPHAGSDKMQEFEKCPFGITGLETALGLSLETLVHTGKISMMRLVELFTINPARVVKLDKGRLSAGSVADVTIFDPQSMWTYDVNKSFSKSRNSPFHDHLFRGGPVTTIVNGVVVWSR